MQVLSCMPENHKQDDHVVNTTIMTMMASAVLLLNWKSKVPRSQMFSTLVSTSKRELLLKFSYGDTQSFIIVGITITPTDHHIVEPNQWLNNQVKVGLNYIQR